MYEFKSRNFIINIFLMKNILLVTNPEGKNKIIAPQEIILAQATTRAGFSILARVVDHPGENFHSYLVQYSGQQGWNFCSFPVGMREGMILFSKFLPCCQQGGNSIPSLMATGKEFYSFPVGMREGMILCSKFLPCCLQGRNSIPSRLVKIS